MNHSISQDESRFSQLVFSLYSPNI